MSAEPKTNNHFVRFLIATISLLLSAMVAYRFLRVTPKGEISAGLITLILIVVMLSLAESFDNFSIGKLFTMSRRVEEKEKDIVKLERDKEQLLAQLVSVSVTQNQNHTNVFGDLHSAAVVSRATGQEIDQKNSDEVSESLLPISADAAEAKAEPTRDNARPIEHRMRMNPAKVEEIAFRKYFGDRYLQTVRILRDVKLSEKDQTFDPISTSAVIFDAYFSDPTGEAFIEFKSSNISGLFRDRLYVMLSKILHYRNTKRVHAQLDLVLIKMPGEVERVGGIHRALRDFGPAIDAGLLKLRDVELTQEEADSCLEPVP